MKKGFFRCSSPCFKHLLLLFTGKTNIQSSKWGRPCDFYGTQLRETSRVPNDGTLWGRPRDVGHICFLNSTQKHIKLTLTGYYSSLYSELW